MHFHDDLQCAFADADWAVAYERIFDGDNRRRGRKRSGDRGWIVGVKWVEIDGWLLCGVFRRLFFVLRYFGPFLC